MDYAQTTSSSLVGEESGHSQLLRPADLLQYLKDLPVGAATLPRLQSLLLNDDADIAEVMELVKIDAGLSTRVMQAAGSVWHKRGEGVGSLDEAIARLGFREAYRIVSAFCLGKFLNAPLKVYGISAQEFWRRSLAAALIAERLAEENKLDEGIAYTTGLLHLIGLVFLDRHLRQHGGPNSALRETAHSPLFRQERRITGTDHAQVAGIVLRGWRFSEKIIAPIELQYAAEKAQPKSMLAILIRSRELAFALVQTRTAETEPIQGAPSWLFEVEQKVAVLEQSLR